MRYGRPRLFKFIEICISRKPMHDFLLIFHYSYYADLLSTSKICLFAVLPTQSRSQPSHGGSSGIRIGLKNSSVRGLPSDPVSICLHVVPTCVEETDVRCHLCLSRAVTQPSATNMDAKGKRGLMTLTDFIQMH